MRESMNLPGEICAGMRYLLTNIWQINLLTGVDNRVLNLKMQGDPLM